MRDLFFDFYILVVCWVFHIYSKKLSDDLTYNSIVTQRGGVQRIAALKKSRAKE